MKFLIVAALLLSPVANLAEAKVDASALLSRLQKKERTVKKGKFLSAASRLSTPFLKVVTSPEQPSQGDRVTYYVQPTSTFEDLELLVSASFDGQAIILDQPAPQLWTFSPGELHEMRTHTFAVELKAQNAQDASDLRTAIAAVQIEIDSLNDQIDLETDPVLRDQLIAQRDEKVSVKGRLQASLADLPFLLANEMKTTKILAGTNAPKIFSVSPNLGGTKSGNLITITGQGFGFGAEVILGGKSLAIVSRSPTKIVAYASDYNEGLQSLEVKFTTNGVKKNAVLENAYFVSSTLDSPSNASPTFSGEDVEVAILAQGTPIRAWFSLLSPPEDADGTVESCLWNFGGISVAGDPNDFCFAAVEFPQAGSYPFSVTIRDNQGATATLRQTKTVVNTALPSGKFTVDPISGSTPLLVNFDASGSVDPDGSPVDVYRWRFSGVSGSFFGQTFQREFVESGVLTVRSTQFQSNVEGIPGLITRKDIRVPLYLNETAPSFGISPVLQIKAPNGWQTQLGNAITLDASDSFDPEVGASIVSYLWDFQDPACSTNCTSNNVNASHTYSQVGHYFPSLTITDNAGGTAEGISELHVVQTGFAPRARVRLVAEEGVAPFTAEFDASSSFDFDGFVQIYEFDPGIEGVLPSSGSVQSVVYSEPGVYFPKFKVTDTDGNWSLWVGTVFVNEAVTEKTAISTGAVEKRISSNQRPQKSMALNEDREEQRERARQKRLLSQACSAGQGSSCFELSKIYQGEGNVEGANLLKERACTLGFAPACGRNSL